MTWYNWLIVVIPFIGVLYMAFHVKKYIRGIPDFLAGGRKNPFFFDKKIYLDYRCLGMRAIFKEIDWRPDENQYQANLKRNTGFLHCINFKCVWGNRNAREHFNITIFFCHGGRRKKKRTPASFFCSTNEQ